MPVNLAQLLANKANASVDFGAAGTLHVEFYPARITTEMLLAFTALQDTARLKSASAEEAAQLVGSPATILPTLLAGWDLTATDAETGAERPVACDAEQIAALGVQVQWALFAGILASQQQSASGEAPASEAAASAPTSDATSQPTAG